MDTRFSAAVHGCTGAEESLFRQKRERAVPVKNSPSGLEHLLRTGGAAVYLREK